MAMQRQEKTPGSVNWLSEEGESNDCPLPLRLHVISLKLTTGQIKVKWIDHPLLPLPFPFSSEGRQPKEDELNDDKQGIEREHG